ncbi:LysR family transcriptional regulator [Microlunatus soli]|uniref:DNA-binding transcriptional regulator, LysR family n=1 Tax=Microlunatus soli TaxID=630515 RepID=A0A1H1XI44_9ACTN|nr:LysR family transcriptional regulator [Microlunatus soli]SDT08860.1 DNA-binding transcriptional regulator, LysR family [Microlunatus soli]
MELRQLEHFIAVASEQHFTRAAEALVISQSGLSASVRALEHELGTPLFTRSTRRVVLTQAGQAFLEEARRTVASAAAARSAVDAVRGVLGGTLSIGTEQCLGVVDLGRELARFRKDHPGVEVRLGFEGSAELVDRVAAGQMDLAMVAECGEAPAGVRTVRLSTESFAILCHPEHRFAELKGVTLDEIAAEPQVGFLPGWGARVLAERAFAAAGLPSRVTMEVNDVHTLLDLVGHGLGVAVVPEHFRHKRPQTLRTVPIKGDELEWNVAIAVPEQPGPAGRVLLDQILQAV